MLRKKYGRSCTHDGESVIGCEREILEASRDSRDTPVKDRLPQAQSLLTRLPHLAVRCSPFSSVHSVLSHELNRLGGYDEELVVLLPRLGVVDVA